jgi:6-phosphogluconolactonase
VVVTRADGSPASVVRFATGDEVARRVAAELVAVLDAVQRHGRVPSIVLTGGTISRKVHAAVVAEADRDSVDWGRVEVWFGDERYVPTADPERNAGQAEEDLLRHLPFDRGRVHVMAASDAGHSSPEDAAAAYAEELTGATARRSADEPLFDLLMLGIGPDGHCASLFPGRDEVDSPADVLAVHDSPKPPPTRISLGMRTLRRAREVWFVAVGEEKAPAVARSVAGGDVRETPSAGPRGVSATRWYVDQAAAADLP